MGIRWFTLIATVALVSGCGDDPAATPPPSTRVAHIGHAAPGHGPFVAYVNGDLVDGALRYGDSVQVVIDLAEQNVLVLQGADGRTEGYALTFEVGSRGHVGVLLTDEGDRFPTLHTFHSSDVPIGSAGVRAIHAIPDGPIMRITLSGTRGRAMAGLGGYLGTAGLGVGAGSVSITVDTGPPDALDPPTFDFGTLRLHSDEYFIAVAPDETGTRPGHLVVF